MSSYPSPNAPVDDENCMLLGPTALVVQAIMGLFVVLSLVYKRFRERPRRPWRIWIFDVSKQIIGQAIVHLLNLGISDLVSTPTNGNNPCTAYFVNVTFDVTVGVGIIWAVLHGSDMLFTKKLGLQGFTSGSYGNPPSISYWGRQLSIYLVAVIVMKLGILALLALFPALLDVGEWLLSWTGGSEAVQIVFVMGIYPIVMNVLQFWLIDSIVKATAYIEALEAANASSRQSVAHNERDSDDEGDDEDDPLISSKTPHLDIESQAQTAGSSTSNSANERARSPAPSEPRSIASSFGRKMRAGHSQGPSTPLDTSHAYPPSLSPSSLRRRSLPPSPSPLRRPSLPPSPAPSATPVLYGAAGESPRLRDGQIQPGWTWEDKNEAKPDGPRPRRESWKMPAMAGA